MINLRNKKIDFVNSATINDAKNYRLISFKKEGKCEQEVIDYHKNLIDFSKLVHDSTVCTLNFSNDTLKITGIDNSTSQLCVLTYDLLDVAKQNPGKSLYFSFENTSVQNIDTMFVDIIETFNGGATNKRLFENQVQTSVTIPSNSNNITMYTFRIYINVETDLSSSSIATITKPMLHFGTESIEYEPYKELMPSPDNPSEIKSIKGTNLLKGLSTSTTDTDYWYSVSTPYFTPLEDGWGKFEYDNTSGTSTAFVNAKVKLNAVELKENTNYTLIMEIRNSNISENAGAFLQMVSANATIAFQNAASLGYYNINSGGIYKSVIKTKESFTGISTAIDTYLRLAKGTKGTVEARISLFEGDVPIPDYVPYGCIQIKNVGKNLVNPNGVSKIESDLTFTNNGNGIFTVSGTSTTNRSFRLSTQQIELNANQPYTQSVITIAGTKIGEVVVSVKNRSNKITYNYIAGNQTITSTENLITNTYTYYIAAGKTVNWTFKVQLEKGSTSTDYETYQENILNLDLQGNELCSLPDGTKDELIIENGRAKIIKRIGKVVFNGSENWQLYEKAGPQPRRFGLRDTNVPDNLSMISNYFACKLRPEGYQIDLSLWTQLYYYAITDINSYWIDATELKNWLSAHNTIVYFKLEIPIEIDFGAVILPETFEGINNINVSSNLDSNTSIVYVNEIVEFKSSLIKVYDSTETTFATNGIKTLHPLLAEVTKKDNGDYYLELRDTLDNLDYYQKGMIIRCTTPWGVQGFRCDNPIINNKRIECKAWHLSYDSKNYIIKDAYAVDKNCNDALNHFNSSTDKTSPFTCVSDIAKIVSTRAVRKTLFEVYEWLITDEKYGGHWYRDNWNLSIKSSIGEDRGVVLAQNKNITDMKISENWDNVCTKILPYTTDGENAILLDDTYVEVGEELYDLPYSKVIKFENQLKQEDYETYDAFLTATKTWLEAQANSYLQENKFPKINYSVSAKIDNISDVGDVIHVKHPKCKVDITTNVIGITYDVNQDKYIKIEFGNFKKEIKNLAQEISETVKKDTENKIEEAKNLLQKELEDSTSKINNTFGNSYVIYEGDKILVVDTLPKENAKYVIKISNGGIGFSQNGINGTFTSAWTIDGTLNMQNINVINLTASLIKGGTLKLGGLNNSSGTFELYDETGRLMLLEDKTGLTVYALNGDYVKLNADVGFAGYNKNDVKIYWADGEVFHMRNAEVENELKVAGMIKFVPVNTSDNRGIGIVAIPG